MIIHSSVVCPGHVSGPQCTSETVSGRDNGLIRWTDEGRRPALWENTVKGSFIQEAITLVSTWLKNREKKIPSPLTSILEPSILFYPWFAFFMIPLFWEQWKPLVKLSAIHPPRDLVTAWLWGFSFLFWLLLLPYLIFLTHWFLHGKIWSLPSMLFCSGCSYDTTVLPRFCLPSWFLRLGLWCYFLSKAFTASFSCHVISALSLMQSQRPNCILILWYT